MCPFTPITHKEEKRYKKSANSPDCGLFPQFFRSFEEEPYQHSQKQTDADVHGCHHVVALKIEPHRAGHQVGLVPRLVTG